MNNNKKNLKLLFGMIALLSIFSADSYDSIPTNNLNFTTGNTSQIKLSKSSFNFIQFRALTNKFTNKNIKQTLTDGWLTISLITSSLLFVMVYIRSNNDDEFAESIKSKLKEQKQQYREYLKEVEENYNYIKSSSNNLTEKFLKTNYYYDSGDSDADNQNNKNNVTGEIKDSNKYSRIAILIFCNKLLNTQKEEPINDPKFLNFLTKLRYNNDTDNQKIKALVLKELQDYKTQFKIITNQNPSFNELKDTKILEETVLGYSKLVLNQDDFLREIADFNESIITNEGDWVEKILEFQNSKNSNLNKLKSKIQTVENPTIVLNSGLTITIPDNYLSDNFSENKQATEVIFKSFISYLENKYLNKELVTGGNYLRKISLNLKEHFEESITNQETPVKPTEQQPANQETPAKPTEQQPKS